MDRLTDGAELLDGPLDDRQALAGNLRDLARINRWLGGVSLSARAIDVLAPRKASLTLIDVGTGGADIPMALLARARRRRRALTVVAVDERPEIVAIATAAAERALVRTDQLEVRQADGRALPFPDGSFDIAHASLVLHHLSPAVALKVIGEMARVARLGVIVNDLHRSRPAWLGAWLIGHLLTGNRLTRVDAPLSVRRAYTAEETTELLAAAGLVPVAILRSALGQRYAIAALRVSRAAAADRSAEPPDR